MLYMARDNGSGDFFPTNVFAHLFIICNADNGFGETDNLTITKGIRADYTRNDTGLPAIRIDDLVNECSPVTAGLDIVVYGVDDTFVLADNSVITSCAGVTYDVGDPDSPSPNDITIIYDTSDCGGSGYWVDKDGGGTTSFPPVVLLYHELAHAYMITAGTAPATIAQEETAAETDENVMRDQSGLPHRDVNSHTGGCGNNNNSSTTTTGPICCIVVSVSTGSAYSDEVNRLRVIRDHLIRQSRVGNAFITRLLYEYYGFSPEVCTAMAIEPALVSEIRNGWVVPLIFALESADVAVQSGFSASLVGARLLQQSGIDGDVTELDSLLRLGHAVQAALEDSGELPHLLPPMAVAMVPILRRSTRDAGYVKWGIVEIVGHWSRARAALLSGANIEEAGAQYCRALEGWLAKLPVDDIWSLFGTAEAEHELELMGEAVYRTRDTRRGFADNLSRLHPQFEEASQRWIERGL